MCIRDSRLSLSTRFLNPTRPRPDRSFPQPMFQSWFNYDETKRNDGRMFKEADLSFGNCVLQKFCTWQSSWVYACFSVYVILVGCHYRSKSQLYHSSNYDLQYAECNSDNVMAFLLSRVKPDHVMFHIPTTAHRKPHWSKNTESVSYTHLTLPTILRV